MDREQLLRRVGSLQQLAYIRPVTFEEGRAKGLRAYEVKNGPLSYRVLADKCLDVEEFCYKGVNLNFLSKPGLQGRNHYDTHGDDLYHLIQNNQAYGDIMGPKSIQVRYVTEDVPMSLVPISTLGRVAGVPTPNIDAVIQLTSAIYQTDFRSQGRCAANLGLEGMTKEQVAHYFETGER